MKALATTIVGTLVALSSASALGAAPDAPPATAKKRTFAFEGDTVSTEGLRPGATVIEGVTRARRSSLIEVRTDFVPEVLRSADDV